MEGSSLVSGLALQSSCIKSSFSIHMMPLTYDSQIIATESYPNEPNGRTPESFEASWRLA